MKQPPHYSGLSKLNHWVTALLVTVMLVLGFAAGGAPDEATEGYLMSLHIGLGFFVFLVVIWRVAYRLYEGFKANTASTAPERWLAWAVHRLLLVALVAQVITGPLYLFTEGEGVDVFGWFTVYLPLESLAVIHEPAFVLADEPTGNTSRMPPRRLTTPGVYTEASNWYPMRRHCCSRSSSA
mgnify:CR=1 FL=1